MASPEPVKVAVFTPGPPLREGGVPVYAIVYTRDGVEIGRGFARGDQLDSWRDDLTADGWTVDIKES